MPTACRKQLTKPEKKQAPLDYFRDFSHDVVALCSIINFILSSIPSAINTVDILDHITSLRLSHVLHMPGSDT